PLHARSASLLSSIGPLLSNSAPAQARPLHSSACHGPCSGGWNRKPRPRRAGEANRGGRSPRRAEDLAESRGARRPYSRLAVEDGLVRCAQRCEVEVASTLRTPD